MIYFIKGVIESLKTDSIILNNNNIGYQIYVSHVDHFKIGEEVKILIHEIIKEDCNYYVGFKSMEEKLLFKDLIRVSGLGPKTAISALRVTTPEEVRKAIECNNVSFLKKLPGIGGKVAYQIILDLKGKYSTDQSNPKLYEEAKEGLINLGFKKSQVERVLANINEPNISVNQLIKIALPMLKK